MMTKLKIPFYRFNFVESVSACVSKPAQVIVVDSHIDRIPNKNLELFVSDIAKICAHKQCYRGFVAVDCHCAGGEGVESFISLLSSCCKSALDDCDNISYYCHVLYSFINKLKEDVAISLEDLHRKLQSHVSLSTVLDYSTLVSYLAVLSDKGLILFLNNPQSTLSASSTESCNTPNTDATSWIVIDKTCLLKDVDGILFNNPFLASINLQLVILALYLYLVSRSCFLSTRTNLAC